MTLLAISFYATHMHFVRSMWGHRKLELAINRSLTEHADGNTAFVRQGCEDYVGGTLVVFHWEKNRVLWQIPITGAAGFCWHDNLLYINTMRLCETIAVDGFGREQKRFSHTSFNNLHTIVPTKRGFLCTSSGIDSILEVDQNGTLLYEWCALEHGYNQLSGGQTRVLDRTLDHRYFIYPTNGQVTHINSARFADVKEDVILATLFQQGTVISISRETGHVQTLLEGLQRPHDVRPHPHGGWIVSNTAANETLVFDEDWHIVRRIAMDFDWVQSSTALSDGSIVIADANNHRLVRVHNNERHANEIRAFPRDWKIFLVEEVPTQFAKFFQHPIAGPPW